MRRTGRLANQWMGLLQACDSQGYWICFSFFVRAFELLIAFHTFSEKLYFLHQLNDITLPQYPVI